MFDRRTMIAGSLALSAMPMVANCAVPGRTVVVVGAGIAGLAAAADLRVAGMNVIVLEVRDRIGGRIHTSTVWSDLPMDLGASWIHGTDGNPVTALAAEAGAETVATSYDSALLHIDPVLRASGAVNAGTGHAERLVDKALAWAERQSADVSLERALRAVAPAGSLDARTRAQLDFYVSGSYEQEYSGSSTELSAWWTEEGDEFGGGDALFPGGYRQITDYLARGLDIRLSQQVSAISTSSKAVSIELTDGTVIDADEVIVTVPLGVLKQGDIRFDPPLPQRMQAAIDRLGMGLLNKHWLRFDKVFWPPEYDWHEYLSPGKGAWSQWVSLAKVDGAPVLLVFSAGRPAERLEALSDGETLGQIMGAARQMFGSSIPDPISSQHTRWRSDPFAGGSYSFYAVGSTPDDRKALASTEHERLHFAGEAQSVRYPGTVHGALLSGREAAQRIIAGRTGDA